MFFDANPEEVPLRRKVLVHAPASNDLEEPLSPKEPQEEAIPRGANH